MDTSQAQIARIASHRTHEQGNPGRGSSRQGPVHSNPEGSYRVTPIHTQFPVFPKSHNFFASVSEKTDIWENCYDVGWKGDIIPEAFSHPAKFSRGLIHRIYEHAKEMGWVKPGDWVLVPRTGALTPTP